MFRAIFACVGVVEVPSNYNFERAPPAYLHPCLARYTFEVSSAWHSHLANVNLDVPSNEYFERVPREHAYRGIILPLFDLPSYARGNRCIVRRNEPCRSSCVATRPG
jgi:hypothetical protein